MSPILEISLAIVFCLWVIPLTWALSTTIRSLPGLAKALIEWTANAPANLVVFIRSVPLRYEAYVENRQLALENSALEKDYQRIQYELIVQRALVAQAASTKREFESKIQKLTEEIQGLQSSTTDISATEKENPLVATRRESLLQLEKEHGSHELKLKALRNELEEKEAVVQKAYDYKRAFLATHKAIAAGKKVKKILATDGVVEDTIRRMEEKVVGREAQAYAVFFLDDYYVSFPSVARSIERLSIEKLELEELKELLGALDLAASELHTVVYTAISYERVLRLQADTCDEEAKNCAKRAEIAEQEGRDHAATDSKQWQFEYAKSAQEFRIMFESSKICSGEFTQMHANFAQKEREIFNRIAELERLNANDLDNLELNSESQSAEC